MHADTTTTVAEGDIIPAEAPLDATLETHAQLYLDAKRRFGQSILDAARAVAEARKAARHGQWDAWLRRVGLSASGAKRLIDIHETAACNRRFADAIRTGFLSATVAGELAQGDATLLERFLTREQPPTRSEVQQAKRETNPPPVADLEPAPPPDLLERLRDALLNGDYAASVPLLRQIPAGPVKNEWRSDQKLAAEIAALAREGKHAGAHRAAGAINDPALRAALLERHPAPAPVHEPDAVPPPVRDPYAPVRLAILAGPHRWPQARKLISELAEPARTAWDRDLLAVQAIDQDLRGRRAGRLDELIDSIRDERLRDDQRLIVAGACQQLGLNWPRPVSDPHADLVVQIGQLLGWVEVGRLADPLAGDKLDEARQLIRRLPPDEQREPLARLMELGALVARSQAPVGVTITVESTDPSSDRWALDGSTGPEGYRGGQLGALLRRLWHLAATTTTAQQPAQQPQLAPVTPLAPEPAAPRPAPEDDVISNWMVVEDDDGREVVQIDALGMPPEAAEAIAAIAAALRLIALGHAHAVDTPQLDQLTSQVAACDALTPGATGVLISVLETVASDADHLAELQVRAA